MVGKFYRNGRAEHNGSDSAAAAGRKVKGPVFQSGADQAFIPPCWRGRDVISLPC